MKKSIKRGFGFGITSGIITTLGVIIGLYSTTKSLTVIIGGIISIAIADSFSDAFGIHVSEESVSKSDKKIWSATGYTLISKLFFASTFIVPFLIFGLERAIIVSIIYGLVLLTGYSYKISLENKRKPLLAVAEHVLIAIVVIGITYFVGDLVRLIS